MSQPEPPQDVALIYTDGTRQAVDCVYEGMEDGMHQWRVVTPLLPKVVKQLAVAMLPPMTEISVPVDMVWG